ncbi:MAG: hypothetical protein WDW38_009979 [Sanguina aurantia]
MTSEQGGSGTIHSRRRGGVAPASSSAPAGDAAVAGESAAESAERHRLNTPGGIDVQMVGTYLEHLTPYLCVLAGVLLFSELSSLFVLLLLCTATSRMNTLIRQQLALKRDFQRQELIAGISYSCLNAGLALFISHSQQLWRHMALIQPLQPLTAWHTLLTAVLVDSIARLLGMVPKFLTALVQTRILTCMEHTLLLYRTLLPVPLWYMYFLHCIGGDVPLAAVASSALTGVYLALKVQSLQARGKLLLLSWRLVFRAGAVYGSYAKREELMESGAPACPICQDGIKDGVKLQCSHVYCEECISEWLERDRTCPMCRAEVKPAGLVSCGDGATSLLPQIF